MRNQFDIIKFSVTIKVWRNLNGFTVRQMAELTGMATSTLSFVENGERVPTMAEFSHLCDLMQFDAASFFKASEKRANG